MASFSNGVLFLLVLLVVALPLYSSTLDAEERQKEEQAAKGATEDVSKADMAPQPPQDLVVDVQSDSVVLLTWGRPSDTTDLDHYLVYVEDEDMEDSTENTFYVWNSLEACTNYTFGVRSVSAVGDMSAPELGDGRTEVGRSPPPQNLHGENKHSTSMTLTWDEPDTPCDVESYRVKWSLDWTDSESTQVTNTSYTVTNLLPSTTYIFSVSAFTSGEGDPATIQETTADDEGGPPENLVAVGVNSSAIYVSWSPPPYKTPKYYRVKGLPCLYLETNVFELSYVIAKRPPCEACEVSVTSVYDNSPEYTESTIGETLPGDPPPPKSCSVDVQDNHLTVNWVTPDSDCDLGLYNVLWTSTKLWGDGEEDSGSMNTSSTHYSITYPPPYTTYSFEISASIDDVFGNPASCSGTSPEALPGPPVILSVVSEQGAAVVTWETPAEENGLIVKYGIFVDGGTDPVMQVAGDEHSARVDGLEPCGSVGLTVKARNGAGWGSSSEVEYVTVDGNDPPPPKTCSVEVQYDFLTASWVAPDSNCTLGKYNVLWTSTKLWADGEEDSGSVNTSATQYSISYPAPHTDYRFEISASIDGVFGSPAFCSGTSHEALPGPPVILSAESEQGAAVVTWETPAEENGFIVKYGIFDDGGTDPVTQVAGDEHTARVEGLEPCVSVGLTVKALNGAGWGSSSEMEYVTVDGDVLPQQVNCAADDLEVEVCWLPYSDSCPVSRYNLKWEGDVLWSDDLVDSDNTTMDWSATEACYSISALPYTKYSVELTVGSGDEGVKCSAVTPMAAPGPPAEVNLATESLVITVTWSEPERKNGIIDFYQVQYEDSAGGIGFRITEDNSTFSSEIQEASCGVTVDVTVRAKVVTVAELGDASPPVTAYLVNSVKTLNCESSKPGQVSLSWTLKEAECPVGFYNLTWTYYSLWSDDAGDGWENVGKDDTSATVTSLPAYSSVFLQIHVDNNPEFTDCNVTTPEEASSKPTSVKQIANGTSSVTVAWGLPLSIRGTLNGWRLRWKTMNGDLIDEDVTDPEDMTYEISELSSSSTYVVYVMAINGAGEGDPEKINVTTA